jgi:FHA domain
MFITVTFVVALGSSLLGNPLVIVVAGLIVAAVIAVGALYLFRSSGKKKRANSAAQGAMGAADWQRQAQQQQGTPAAWNQPPMGMPTDNSWQQQQQAAPGAWNPQQDNPWAQPAQQQQGAPPAWNQPPMDNPWGQPAQQQPGWNAPAQQPATAWDTQGAAQQQAGGWAAPNPSQQAGGWSPPGPAQAQANPWGSPSPAPQQAGSWGNQGAQAAGSGGQQGWDTAPAAGMQDPWGQPQAQQQSAPPWNAQSSAPASPQQAQTAYGGAGSAQPWSQPAQPAQSSDPWGQPAAPAQQAAWPQPFQQGTPPPSPTTGNVGWQQAPNQGYPAPGMFPHDDGDKTMLRSNTGPQGRLGIVRIEEGKEPGRVYEVRKDSLSIGRSRESDIFLEDLAVSRLHASIVSLGSGNYALRDEGSANGTKVNGQTVNKYQPYPLQEGDKIQLGQTVLVFAKH